MANARKKYEYKSIAISCKAKNLLEEIAEIFEEKNKDRVVNTKFNRVIFVSELIEEAYRRMKEEN
jgi:hypothetical protein